MEAAHLAGSPAWLSPAGLGSARHGGGQVRAPRGGGRTPAVPSPDLRTSLGVRSPSLTGGSPPACSRGGSGDFLPAPRRRRTGGAAAAAAATSPAPGQVAGSAVPAAAAALSRGALAAPGGSGRGCVAAVGGGGGSRALPLHRFSGSRSPRACPHGPAVCLSLQRAWGTRWRS